jgi:hypothetical protein
VSTSGCALQERSAGPIPARSGLAGRQASRAELLGQPRADPRRGSEARLEALGEEGLDHLPLRMEGYQLDLEL